MKKEKYLRVTSLFIKIRLTHISKCFLFIHLRITARIMEQAVDARESCLILNFYFIKRTVISPINRKKKWCNKKHCKRKVCKFWLFNTYDINCILFTTLCSLLVCLFVHVMTTKIF